MAPVAESTLMRHTYNPGAAKEPSLALPSPLHRVKTAALHAIEKRPDSPPRKVVYSRFDGYGLDEFKYAVLNAHSVVERVAVRRKGLGAMAKSPKMVLSNSNSTEK